MKAKVKVRRYGVIHYHAGCYDCDWLDGMSTTHPPKDVRAAVRRHVATKGHTVWIESGTHTTYSAIKEGDHHG